MASLQRMKHLLSPFRFQVYYYIHTFNVGSIDEVAAGVKVTGLGTMHRHRVRQVLADLFAEGHIERVGRGIYAIHPRYDHPQARTFKEQLAKFLEQRGCAQLPILEAVFPDKSSKAIRSALDRLRAQEIVSKNGIDWYWTGNVVNLDKHRDATG